MMTILNKGFRLTSYAPKNPILNTCEWGSIKNKNYNYLKASIAGMDFDLSFLEEAAPIYKISSNPEDYVYNQLKALTIDLPNRNLYNFTAEEMNRFEPSFGCRVFETFKGKPIYHQHRQILNEAKGVILHSELQKINNCWYIVLINAIDKKKSPSLAKQAIDKNNPLYYSMGCTSYELVCSICKNKAPNQDYKCVHTKEPIRGSIVNGYLAYEDARQVVFTEESIVSVPADTRASRLDDRSFTAVDPNDPNAGV